MITASNIHTYTPSETIAFKLEEIKSLTALKKISNITLPEFHKLLQNIIPKREELAQQAAKAGGVLYRFFGAFPRKVQIESNGKIYIHFNKQSKDKLIGEGDGHRVHYCLDLNRMKLRAASTIKIEQDTAKQVINELKIYQKLQGQPGVVKTYSAHLVKGKDCEKGMLIQYHYSTGDVYKNLHTLQLPQKYKITLNILQGYRTLECNQIFHRDPKLENILLSKKMKAVVADFDLATFAHDKEANSCYAGNWIHASPERLCTSRKELDAPSHQSDMWGVGMLLFELFTGEPFIYEANDAIAYNQIMHMTDDFIRARLMQLPLPSTIASLMQDCLHVNVHERITAGKALQKFGPSLKVVTK